MDLSLMDISLDLLKHVLYGKIVTKMCPDNINVLQNVVCPSQIHIGQATQPGHVWGVFTSDWVRQGTEMGPFIGRNVQPSQIDTTVHNESTWELIDERGDITSFIVGSPACWLSYVNCARHEEEQNLELIQVAGNFGDEIYYKATKNISPGQELLVWYGTQYNLFFGVPGTCSFSVNQDVVDGVKRPHLRINELSPEAKLRCTICKRGFNSKSNLRSHMRIHTQEKPFVCKYCKRSFSQSSTLRNHIRLHTGERPYRCTYCQCSYSQLAGLRAHQKSAKHRPFLESSAAGKDFVPTNYRYDPVNQSETIRP